MKIAVDFDGTCVDHRYPEVGPDVPGAKETLQDLHKKGVIIFLNTMRGGSSLEDAVQWFKERDIFLSGINGDPSQQQWTSSPKCYANYYIDDAAIGCPLIQYDGFEKPCVDWEVVAKELLKVFNEGEESE